MNYNRAPVPIETAIEPTSRPPLGLPSGSVRAYLTLLARTTLIVVVVLSPWLFSNGFVAVEYAVAEEPAKQTDKVDIYGDPLPAGAIARIGTARFGNAVSVYDYAISSDERVLATLTKSRSTIRFWDIDSGKELSHFDTGATRLVQLGAFAKNGVLAMVEDRARIVVYEVKTQRVLTTISLEAPYGNRDRFSGPWVSDVGNELIFCVGNRATVYDTTNGKKLREFPCFGVCGYSPARHMLATASNNEVRLLDVATGKEIPGWTVIREDRLDTSGIALSADGSLLAFVRRTRQLPVRPGASLFRGPWEVVLIQTANGNRIGAWNLGIHHGPDCTEISFSAGNQYLVVPGVGDLRIWNVPKLVELPCPTVPVGSRARCLARTRQLLCLTDDLEILDLETRLPDKKLPGRNRVTALSPDGKLLATHSAGSVLQMWDTTTGAQLWNKSCECNHSCTLLFTANSRQLISLSAGYALRWWDVKDGTLLNEIARRRPLYPLEEEFGGIIAYNRHPELLAVHTSSTVFIFDPSTRQKVTEFDLPLEQKVAGYPDLELKSLAFSPDGRILALGDSDPSTAPPVGHISLWDIARRRQVGRFEATYVRGLEFTPCGKFLSGAVLVEVATGQLASDIPGPPIPHLGAERFLTTYKFEYPENNAMRLTTRIQSWDMFLGRAVLNQVVDHYPAGWNCVSSDGKIIVTSEFRNSLLIRNVSDYIGPVVAGPIEGADVDFEACWNDLGADSAVAYKAMTALTRANDRSVEFLSRKLPPANAKDLSPVREMLARLQENSPEAFDQAQDDLLAFGPQAIAILKDVLANDKNFGPYRTVEDIIIQLESPMIPDRTDLRGARSVQVLERIGSLAAMKLLERLASGAPHDRLTTCAAAAVHRAKETSAAKPKP